MAEIQETRDKRKRGIRSNPLNEDKIHRIKRVKDIIQDLERYGPTGLIHIAILSSIIKRSIRIWNADSSLNRIIGKGKIEQPIDIEYHAIDSDFIGHWTLRHAKDPQNTDIELNSCLFSVIGSQIKQAPSELRRWTVQGLKANFRQLVDQIDEIFQLGKNNRVMLMIGGARYCGTSANDAKIILDKSQNMRCYECTRLGHPRGHASHPDASGESDSVENYSRDSLKSAFLSRNAQDEFAHLALKSWAAQGAMKMLNHKQTNLIIQEIFTEVLLKEAAGMTHTHLSFKGKRYLYGKPISSEKDIKLVKIVMGHHEGKENDPDADVYVHTFYPVLVN